MQDFQRWLQMGADLWPARTAHSDTLISERELLVPIETIQVKAEQGSPETEQAQSDQFQGEKQAPHDSPANAKKDPGNVSQPVAQIEKIAALGLDFDLGETGFSQQMFQSPAGKPEIVMRLLMLGPPLGSGEIEKAALLEDSIQFRQHQPGIGDVLQDLGVQDHVNGL